MTTLGERLRMAYLAFRDPLGLVAYQQGGRMLQRDEAERVAEIVIRQVSYPIEGLRQEIADTTTAINEVSATLLEAQRDRLAGFERIYGLIETIVSDKEHAHAVLHAEIRDVREAATLLHQAYADLDRRVGALEAQTWPSVADAPGD